MLEDYDNDNETVSAIYPGNVTTTNDGETDVDEDDDDEILLCIPQQNAYVIVCNGFRTV